MRRRKIHIWPLRVLSLLCALTFLFSAFMTGTYAWDSEQQALNNLYGNKDVMVPVELVKLERAADGSETDITVPEAVFYLYRENGTQIGGRYITDENGKINVQLVAGKYYFEEVSPSIGYTYDTDSNGDSVTRYFFTVIEQEETITVKAYNKRLDGDLLIRKAVENTDGSPLNEIQLKTTFEFTVTFSDGGTYSYKIDNGEEQTLVSGDTLKLCGGQTAVFEKLPVGLLYDVVETPTQGYITTSTGHRGNITEDTQSVADFINRCEQDKMGSLIVSKEVEGVGADTNKEFSFAVTLGDFTEEITLKHGESKEFTGIPVGTEYTVTELNTNRDRYLATVDTYEGRIVAKEAVTAHFVNIYSEIPPTDNKGSLSVSKTVTGDNGDPSKEFVFRVVFEGKNAPPEETFTLKAGESKTFKDLPHGITYTVTETGASGYDALLDTASGIIVGDHSAEIVFTNKIPETAVKTVKLTVQKLLAGEVLESDKARVFNLTLSVNGEVTEFTLKADETMEFDIPLGTAYEVSEQDYIQDGFSQSIVNGSGIAAEELTEVIVTNTYVGEARLEIIGQKTWNSNGQKVVVLPKSITIRLKNGERLVEERIVKPDINNQWKYTFIVPKYNADGTEAVYTLEEDDIPGFRASYNGYNIKNTYVKPIEVDPPIITKVVRGDNVPTAIFEFFLTGQHGTPMPEDSVGYRKELKLTGAGELEIGTITYDKPGTYVYTVHEKNGGAEGWTYDTALYTVTVVVTEEDYVLSAQTTIEKQGSVVDKLEFINSFDRGDDEKAIISGIKTWHHGDNPTDNHPDSIVVYVYANGALVVQSRVTAEDNWKYSFELPRYDANGTEFVYTVGEEKIADYEVQIDGYNLINTYTGTPDIPDKPVDLPVDSDNPDGPSDSLQTGDNSNILFWFILMILSLIGLVVTAVLGKKQYAYEGKHCKRL